MAARTIETNTGAKLEVDSTFVGVGLTVDFGDDVLGATARFELSPERAESLVDALMDALQEGREHSRRVPPS